MRISHPGGSRSCWLTAVVGSLLLVLPMAFGAANRLSAQDAPVPPGAVATDTVTGRVSGRVIRATVTGESPLAGRWVILHRISRDGTGRPIDSTRTTRTGAFALTYPRVGAADASFFVSTMHHGIANISEMLPEVADAEQATITVFDTTAAPIRLRTQGRHIIIFAPDARPGSRVVEIHTVSNDTVLTRVTPPNGPPVWTAPLPEGAAGFANAPSSLTSETVTLVNGRAAAFAPFSPGIRQFGFTYELPPHTFPVSIPVADSTPVVQILVEAPTGTVAGPGLQQLSPTTIERRTFRRFEAQDVPAGTVFTIDTGASPPARRGTLVALALVLGSIAAVGLLVAVKRKRPVHAVRPPTIIAATIDDETERLARRIAAMDSEFAAHPSPSDDARKRYESERELLKQQLAERLAARPRD
jgi:hypothetical protein